MSTHPASPATDVIDHSIHRLTNLFGDRLPITIKEEVVSMGGVDVDGKISIDGEVVPYFVRPRLTMGQLKALHQQVLKDMPSAILLLGYSDEQQREYCRENNLNFLDKVGNCFINLPALRMAVDGITNDAPARVISRAFQKSGLQLLYAFDRDPGLLRFPYGELAKITGLSKGTVGEVMIDLKEGGFLEDDGDERRLVNGRQLVVKWAHAYVELLRPKLYRTTLQYRGDNLLQDVTDTNNPQVMQLHYSGTWAAWRRGGHLKAFDVILYTDLRLAQLASGYKLFPIGKKAVGETVEVLFPLEPENTMSDPNNHLIGDLVLYADLIRYDDPRVQEAAEKLLDHEIQDRFRQNGFSW